MFGRDTRSDGNGRSHHGEFVSGMLVGTHLAGGLVGGWEVDGKARATGISSETGGVEEADIAAQDTLPAYFKTIMDAAGVAVDRQEVRLPTGTVVESVVG